MVERWGSTRLRGHCGRTQWGSFGLRGRCGSAQWLSWRDGAVCGGTQRGSSGLGGRCGSTQWVRWLDEAIVGVRNGCGAAVREVAYAGNGRGAGMWGGAYGRNGLFCPVLVGGLFRGYDGGFFEDGFDFGDGAL